MKKNNLRKKIAIGMACLAGTLAIFEGGYLAGKKTSEVDYVSIHNEGECVDDYKVVRLHKPYGKDDIFASMNNNSLATFERDYFPMEEKIEGSYGKNTEFSKRRMNDISRLVQE